jgi:tetratricopeptide (TPR) repeat protein
LTPGVLAPEFALAELYGRCGLTNQATTTLDQLRREINLLPEHGGFEAQLALLEAGVWLAQTNFYRASLVLHQAAQQHPEDTAMLNQISRTYFAFGDFTNAEELTARQLATEPDNISALLVQSGILMQNHRADLAIPILNHILVLTNNFHVKLIRAVAEVETTNYAAAQADYHDLETSLPNVFQAEFGLAQIAELEHDTNGAIHYLKRCLANPPSDSVLAQKIRDRLHTLQAVKSGT